MTRTGRSAFLVALALVAALGVVIRVWFVANAAMAPPDPGDAMAYHLLADGLAEGDGYVRPFDRIAGRLLPTAEWGPGFPALLAAGDIAGVGSFDAQRILGAFLGAVTVVVTGLGASRIASRRIAVVAAGIIAVHPLLVLHDTAVLSEGLAMLTGAVVVVAAIAYRDARTARGAALLGASIGVAALVRADAIAVLVLMAMPLVLVSGRLRWRHAGVVAACAAATLVPWTIRNAIRMDAFVPVSTNAATAVAGANCDQTYSGDVVGYWRFGPGCFEGYDTGALVARGEAAVASEHLRSGLEYAADHAERLPVVVGARVLRAWGLWDLDEQVSLTALDERKPAGWVRAGTVFGWVVLVAAAVATWRVARRREWPTLIALIGPGLSITAAAAVTYGNARFRAGAEPALAILASLAIAGRSRT